MHGKHLLVMDNEKRWIKKNLICIYKENKLRGHMEIIYMYKTSLTGTDFFRCLWASPLF